MMCRCSSCEGIVKHFLIVIRCLYHFHIRINFHNFARRKHFDSLQILIHCTFCHQICILHLDERDEMLVLIQYSWQCIIEKNFLFRVETTSLVGSIYEERQFPEETFIRWKQLGRKQLCCLLHRAKRQYCMWLRRDTWRSLEVANNCRNNNTCAICMSPLNDN